MYTSVCQCPNISKSNSSGFSFLRFCGDKKRIFCTYYYWHFLSISMFQYYQAIRSTKFSMIFVLEQENTVSNEYSFWLEDFGVIGQKLHLEVLRSYGLVTNTSCTFYCAIQRKVYMNKCIMFFIFGIIINYLIICRYLNLVKQDELWANAHLWYPRIYVQCA